MQMKPACRQSRRLILGASAALPLLLAYVAQATPNSAPAKLKYNRDVRPILAENCFTCHGPDSAARKAELRLDKPAFATAIKNGRAPIAKGKPGDSEVIKRVTGQGPPMPPVGKKLTAAQIATLKRWIAEGAEYEQHWSYIAPVTPVIPAEPIQNPKSKIQNPGWCRNPIDRFILAKLSKAALQPAPEADRRTLARRLSLVLSGLPPDPADVEAFVSDKSPNAYEKLVDNYLASPQWGEHRARYWLDAARYADTHGIHMDNYREMWSYRDWVINAFNRNLPFDQFTIEQLAGDLLPHPTLDQEIATGFNRCNITSSEGGAIDEEYKVLYARDRTETTSAVFLGSTLNCCVCHDHKFDPFTQRDFYSMSAMFNNTTQAAMDGNIKDTPPVVPVPLESDRPRFEALKGEIASARKQADERKVSARADFERLMSQTGARVAITPPTRKGLAFHAPLNEGQGREVQALLEGKLVRLTAAADPGWEAGHVSEKAFLRKAGSTLEIPSVGDFEKDQSFSCAAWVRIPKNNQGGSVVARMDNEHDYRGWDIWLENGAVGSHIINKWPDNALKVVSKDRLQAGKWQHICVTYGGGANPESLRVYIDGTARPTDTAANGLTDTIRTKVPFKIGQRHSSEGVDGTGIQDVRLYNRALSPDEVAQIARGTRGEWLASRGAARLPAPEKEELFGTWLSDTDDQYRSFTTKTASLENEEREIKARGTVAHVMNERSEEAIAYILNRGEYDKRKDPVKAVTPATLPPLPADYPRNRLGLAKWLVRPENPLTARVTVNRFWQEVFGQGLVRTAGDFGVSGEPPSHPELLDWLAVAFMNGDDGRWTMDDGNAAKTASLIRKSSGDQSSIVHRPSSKPWDIKAFFKLLVTSATYRQAAVSTPLKSLKDPNNRLLSRGPRFRMDAEMVRDYALAASGLLVRKLGGPSVKPYQPDGVWEAVAMIGSNTRDYKRDTGESLYRRSLYTFWKRSAPPASLDIFNAPTREYCTVRRERTNTPLQALVTLNDVQYVEAARVLAERALKDGGSTPSTQIDFIAHKLLARPLRTGEQKVVGRSLANLVSFYAAHTKESKELITTGESKPDAALKPECLAAWTMLCNQLMNLDEVLNK